MVSTYCKTDLLWWTSFLVSTLCGSILERWWVSLSGCWASSGSNWCDSLSRCCAPSTLVLHSPPIVIIIGMWIRCIHAMKPRSGLGRWVNGWSSGRWWWVVYSWDFALFSRVWVNRKRGRWLHLLIQCVSTASNMHTCKQCRMLHWNHAPSFYCKCRYTWTL